MKKIYFALVVSQLAFSQVGILNNSPKAVLDISASNAANPSFKDGVLIPRIEKFPTQNPTADQDGMLVFLTHGDAYKPRGVYYWNNQTEQWYLVNTNSNSNNLSSITSIPFSSNEGYPVYRIPSLIKAGNGDLLLFCEGRATVDDHSNKDAVLKTSKDAGKTWGQIKILDNNGTDRSSNPVPVLDTLNNRIVLFFTRYGGTEANPTYCDIYSIQSDDHGATWSAPINRNSIKPTGINLTNLDLAGPGAGIQLKHGTHAGRLIVPFWGYRLNDSFVVYLVYSDDSGVTWQRGATTITSVTFGTNETVLQEKDNGEIMIISRNAYGDSDKVRSVVYSTDGGVTFSSNNLESIMYSGPVIMGDILKMNENTFVYSSPLNPSARQILGIRVSCNKGDSWDMAHILDNRTGTNTIAYSALEKLDNQNFAIAYETDNYSNIEFKVFNINTDYPYKATYLTDETNTIKAHVSRKGEALYSTGKFGNGLDFDGKTLLVLPNHQNLALDNSNYTINFWFKSTYDNGENEVLLWAFNTNSGLPALWTRLMSDTGYRTLYATGSIENFYTRTLSSLKSDGVWHMATIVRNGSDYQTFIDGVRYNSVNTNFGTASLNSSLYDYGILFGAKPINSALGYTEFYYGSLDEVKIYKRALSQAEINQLLVNGTVSNTNLVYHENFD